MTGKVMPQAILKKEQLLPPDFTFSLHGDPCSPQVFPFAKTRTLQLCFQSASQGSLPSIKEETKQASNGGNINIVIWKITCF